MALEVEWKFLVTHLPELPDAPSEVLRQAYINRDSPAVRVRFKGNKALLGIKAISEHTKSWGNAVTRLEFEYEIPWDDADQLYRLSDLRIEKRRYYLSNGIELDVFLGEHQGLILAEYETPEGGRPPAAPEGWEWVDVTHDVRYTNRALAELGVPAAVADVRDRHSD